MPSLAASPEENTALRTLTPQQQVQQLQMQQQYFPPVPPSEFQKFVAATTGKRLEIYGTDLFRKVPTTFSPSNLNPAGSDYVLGADDELRVRIWGGISYSGNLRVDRSGNIFIPQVGSVHVGGLKFAELDGRMRSAIGRVFRNYDLAVDLGRIRSIQVYITGQARKPGMYTVSALSTLVDAVFASGGPTPSGSMRHIQLKRNGQVVTDFDLYAFLLHGDKSKDLRLSPEDVLYIPPAGQQVALIGTVRNPAIYELRDGEAVAELLDAAGKTTAMASNSKVTLDRAEDNQRRAMDFALDAAGLAVKLRDGDIVHVFSILPAYKQSVTLRGSVANVGHYGWHEGMRLSDLLPDREALLSRDYWWKRSHLGLGTPEYEEDIVLGEPLLDTLSSNNDPNVAKPKSSTLQQNGTQQGQNATQPTAGAAPQQNLQGNSRTQDPSTTNQAGAFSSLARTEDEVDPVTGQPLIKKNVVRVTPAQIYWNYAVIERVDPVTFKTSLLSFDLGKLINEHDVSQDLALQPNDTVTIFSQKDIKVPEEQQTKYVTIEGEVIHAGTYSIRQGETLQDVVNRAGGFTSRAYLYGAEFNRESTKKLQQQRIDEYVRAVELETSRSSIDFANYAAMSNAGGSTAQNTAIYQQFITQLRRIRATGRVVLNLKPNSDSADDLPILLLENGDHLIVPAKPSTINVVGEVYNQNTFIFQKGRTVSYYLNQAGGANRNADTKRALVIHADGSVLSRKASATLFSSNQFLNAKLNPGDTLLMPNKSFRPNVSLKSTLEWTQMFSQLAMGAATISLLK